jgi:uncharacterized DUF497 family protein
VEGFKGQYEWDPAKAEANLGKHKISFETATKVFDDPNFLLIEDRTDETGEQRWNAIGTAEGIALLIVVHVYREDENAQQIIRIISARRADPRERRRYAQQAVE